MIKLAYKPLGVLVSVLGGVLAGAIFKRIWKLAARAKKIITDNWTVPEDVRKRRRSRKPAGKAPQAATTRPDKRGDLPRPRSSRHHGQPVKTAT